MRLAIQTHLKYRTAAPCSLLLQIESMQDASQIVETSELRCTHPVLWNSIAGQDDVGQRRWGQVEGVFDCTYSAVVRVDRPDLVLSSRQASPIVTLPAHVTPYLMPSRHCHPEAFLTFVPMQFGDLSGGALITKMADWIDRHFTYDNGASTAVTTATDSFHAKAGVCRDYAHDTK